MRGRDDSHHKLQNRKLKLILESMLILVVMVALLLIVGLQVFGFEGLWLVLIMVTIMAYAGVRRGKRVIPEQARYIDRSEAPELYSLLDELSSRAGLKREPHFYLLPMNMLNAATIDHEPNPIIMITPPTLSYLSGREMRGIVAHELAHLQNRDLVLLQLIQIVQIVTHSLSQVAWIMLIIFLPLLIMDETVFPFYLLILLFLAPLLSVVLQLAFSKSREYNADLGAVDLTGDPEGLASALEKIDRVHSFMNDMFLPFSRKRRETSLFRSHPHIDRRVNMLRNLD